MDKKASPKKEDGQKRGWASLGFQVLFFLMVLAYGMFLYRAETFRTHSNLKPLAWFFDFVETYSPFHEFISPLDQEQVSEQARLFTPEELKKYDGSNPDLGIYLAILGQVFDVSTGIGHYGPGGGYAFLSGRDASRAFVSGDFSAEGLTDDIRGLSALDYVGLNDWLQFYHKDYRFVGFLIGRFYDTSGRPTVEWQNFQTWLSESVDEQDKKSTEKNIFPPCNSEWSASKGQRVWCTELSGGVQRDWVGVPRRLLLSGRSERCACVKNTGDSLYSPGEFTHNRGDLDNTHLKEFEGCESSASLCQIKPPPEQ